MTRLINHGNLIVEGRTRVCRKMLG